MRNTVKNTVKFRYLDINGYTDQIIIEHRGKIDMVKVNGDPVCFLCSYINSRL